jgi:hypothetical protein
MQCGSKYRRRILRRLKSLQQLHEVRLRGLNYTCTGGVGTGRLRAFVAAKLFIARRLLPALAALLACVGGPATAQSPLIRGYYLHAGAGIESTPLTEGGFYDFQRLRLMTAPRLGPVSLDIAYEHALELRTAPLALGRGFEAAEAAGPWLRLQGTLTEREHFRWRHGFDRLSLTARPVEATRVSVGRQTVSWATTLFFTPADPFAPFDPADPFREFRAGIDAARGELFLGPLSQLDAVVRPARTPVGTTFTALARLSGVLAGVELSAWGGALHDEAAAAAAAAGAVGDVAVRGEASLRRDGGETVARVAVGVDRRFQAFDRDLHLVLEYQHDGFGARHAADLLVVIGSAAYQRGELQVLGRDALAASASYQLHPLLAADALAITNLHDGSLLLAPGLTYSAADEVSVRLGGFAGLGRGATAVPIRLGSEHGATPLVGYAAVSVFF